MNLAAIPFLNRLRAVYRERWRYRRERALLDNRLPIRSNRPSVLFFTTHKCASTYITKCLAHLNDKHLGMNLVDLEGLVWNKHSHDVHQYLATRSSKLFHDKGMIYAPLRRLIDIHHLERYKVLLFIRDPRDVLVSHYYSIAFSHGLPGNSNRRASFLAIRDNVRSMDIDEYVLNACGRFLPIYEEYCELLTRVPNTAVLLYETFATDFPRWASQLSDALEVELSQKDLEELWRLKGGDLPDAENIYAHVRSGAPGGHKDKLKKETLATINQEFRFVLESIDFSIVEQREHQGRI